MAFNRRFDITEKGNFEGKSIPNLLGSDPYDSSFDAVLPQIREYRRARCKLHTDDKILTAWNGLMIAALCELYRVSREQVYLTAAQKADCFIQQFLSEDGALFASFRDGKREGNGFLDDYAGYIFALVALYRTTLDGQYLKRADEFCRKVMKYFADEGKGGFYLYGKDSQTLILWPKETYDGAMPSGNSLMAWNLVCLSQIMEAGIMTKPLPFEDESFDIIFHPVFNCYVEEVRPIWKECYRILKHGGILIAGMDNGINYIFDDDEKMVLNTLPFNPLKNKEQMEQSLRTDSGVQFSHTIEEQVGGQLEAGFMLTELYEDTNGAGNLHEHGIPTFIATRVVKR